MAESQAGINELMQAASDGDPEAFGQLVLSVQDRLYRLALANGLTQADAVEATQEALARAYLKRSSFQPGREVISWLCGFLINVVREQRRKRDRLGLDLDIPAVARETDLARHERLNALGAALEQLPDRQREAVACRYLQQWSVHQTAEAMGCAEGTVKAATAAGLRRLREMLDGYQ